MDTMRQSACNQSQFITIMISSLILQRCVRPQTQSQWRPCHKCSSRVTTWCLSFSEPCVVFFSSDCPWVKSPFLCVITVQLNLCKTATLKKTKNCFSKTNYRLMQVKSFSECPKWSILQCVRPSLSYQLLLRHLLCLFLSGRFTQVLLYVYLVWLFPYEDTLHKLGSYHET